MPATLGIRPGPVRSVPYRSFAKPRGDTPCVLRGPHAVARARVRPAGHLALRSALRLRRGRDVRRRPARFLPRQQMTADSMARIERPSFDVDRLNARMRTYKP